MLINIFVSMQNHKHILIEICHFKIIDIIISVYNFIVVFRPTQAGVYQKFVETSSNRF